MLPAFLALSSTLKMEEICSTEMSVNFQRATRRYIEDDRILQPNVAFRLVLSHQNISNVFASPRSVSRITAYAKVS
jgi:hypothetical protein